MFGDPGDVTGLDSKPLLLWRRALGNESSFECQPFGCDDADVWTKNSESSFGSTFHSSSVTKRKRFG